MGRPLIGLTTYAEPHRYGGRELPSVLLPAAYVRAVHASGGRAVLIPSDDAGADVLDRLDGLLLTGGSDVEPSRYGETPHETVVTRPQRDAAEMLLLRAALERDLPVLGVCRGLQVMAVAYGAGCTSTCPTPWVRTDTAPTASHAMAGIRSGSKRAPCCTRFSATS